MEWLKRQEQTQPYEHLAQVLQAMGYEQAATEVLIGKEEVRREQVRRLYGRLNWRWVWNLLLGITIVHGYKSHHALYFALGFVVSGTILFSWGYSCSPKLISPSHVQEFQSSPQSPKPSEDYPRFNPFFYSLDVFVPIVDLHQQSYWLPNANRGDEIIKIPSISKSKTPLFVFKYRGKEIKIPSISTSKTPLFVFKCGALLRWYFWGHIIFGWILTSLWVAGFTGLVRRVE